jgi:hypothetical protein
VKNNPSTDALLSDICIGTSAARLIFLPIILKPMIHPEKLENSILLMVVWQKRIQYVYDLSIFKHIFSLYN